MRKNALTCLQSFVGITPRGRIQNWHKGADEMFMIRFVIIHAYLE